MINTMYKKPENRKRITCYLHASIAQKIKKMAQDSGLSQGAIIDIAINKLKEE